MARRTILVWFRNDLRIHDNEILAEAVKKAEYLLPVYCFDPRYFGPGKFDTLKTGKVRAKFLLESVENLRQSLQQLGGNLMVVHGRPEEVLPQIAEKYNVSEVYHHREVASRETQISALVEDALWKKQINLKHFIGHTLYHKEDLPFPIKDIPDNFSVFRKKIERESRVRPPFPPPSSVQLPLGFEPGSVPRPEELGIDPEAGAASACRGGETEGLQQVEAWLEAYGRGLRDKSIRNVSVTTSGLSPWIALGCLSMREVYSAVKNFEQKHASGPALSGMVLNLLWRDYFRFMLKKHGESFIPRPDEVEHDKAQLKRFEQWKRGETGVPLIDACMHELNITGFISHKRRQIVADFLIHSLRVDWILGAAYFEEVLVDYSPASNWGNWAIRARTDKSDFNWDKVTRELDPSGEYVRKWLPEIA